MKYVVKFQLRTTVVELILGISWSEVVSSMVAILIRYCLSKKNLENRQGIFSFLRRKLKKDLFFLLFFPVLSNSEATEPESEAAECDSSSTVGGRSECDEALGAKRSPDNAAWLDATDEALVLFGKGGLVERLLFFIVVVCNSVSDTDVVILVATSGMLAVEGEVVAATADAATDPILEAASWLKDLTIMRPLGPTLGVIFRDAGKGGVPVTLPGPDAPW